MNKERKQTYSPLFLKYREKQKKDATASKKKKKVLSVFFLLPPPSSLLTGGGPTSKTRQLGKETEAIHPHYLVFQAICSHFTNPTKMSHVRGKKTRKNEEEWTSSIFPSKLDLTSFSPDLSTSLTFSFNNTFIGW